MRETWDRKSRICIEALGFRQPLLQTTKNSFLFPFLFFFGPLDSMLFFLLIEVLLLTRILQECNMPHTNPPPKYDEIRHRLQRTLARGNQATEGKKSKKTKIGFSFMSFGCLVCVCCRWGHGASFSSQEAHTQCPVPESTPFTPSGCENAIDQRLGMPGQCQAEPSDRWILP